MIFFQIKKSKMRVVILFSYLCTNIDCGYSLEPPKLGKCISDCFKEPLSNMDLLAGDIGYMMASK